METGIDLTFRVRWLRDSSHQPGALRALVEDGAGVAVLDSLSAKASLQEGRLVRLLPQWELPGGGGHAVYPPGRIVSPLAKTFVEFSRARRGSDGLTAGFRTTSRMAGDSGGRPLCS